MSLLSLFANTPPETFQTEAMDVSTTAAVTGVLIFLAIFALIFYAILSYLMSRIFKKAGVAGWKAWVPVYNMWITLELGNQKGWLALAWAAPFITWIPIDWSSPAAIALTIIIMVLGVVGAVYACIAAYHIGVRFGKEGYFVLWYIFLPLVWYAWLAFDDSTWKNKKKVTHYSPSHTTEEQ